MLKLHGSVFPRAASQALTPALATAAISLAVKLTVGTAPELMPLSIYNNFVWILGFFLVFRTGVAYNRYWEGAVLLKDMATEWYDSCAQATCFAETSSMPHEEIRNFQGSVVRLFSLLHCLALQQVAYKEDESFEVLDMEGMDLRLLESVQALKEPGHKAEVVLQWINRAIIEGVKTGMVSTPAPIVSRCFQELNQGMVAFKRLTAITDVPFPFPYAQMISAALLVFWVATPVLLGTLPVHSASSAFFAFISTFFLCALNLVAQEIEQPFGDDANDHRIDQLQRDMNASLLLLLRPDTQALLTYRTPAEDELRQAGGRPPQAVLAKRFSQCMPRGVSAVGSGGLDVSSTSGRALRRHWRCCTPCGRLPSRGPAASSSCSKPASRSSTPEALSSALRQPPGRGRGRGRGAVRAGGGAEGGGAAAEPRAEPGAVPVVGARGAGRSDAEGMRRPRKPDRPSREEVIRIYQTDGLAPDLAPPGAPLGSLPPDAAPCQPAWTVVIADVPDVLEVSKHDLVDSFDDGMSIADLSSSDRSMC